MTRLTDEQRLAWLRLIRSENVGPRTFQALVNRFGGAAAALDALPDLARKAGRTLKVVSRAEAEREIEATARLGGRFVATGEPEYPKALRAIDSAPPLIVVRGAPHALARPMVAIVGSRNASAAGLTFTERLAKALGEAGYTVVSGLARGIDTRAHRGSLATGTVAVLAGGHARVYPADNAPLLEKIVAEGGAAVSEMPLEWEPRGRDFPRRNRIVSGLSLGVVVVEAAHKSGSLITARFALEQGREVFAVPGSPLDPRAAGTNDLIRQGATLCAAPEHVLEPLAKLVEADALPPKTAEEPGWHPYDELDGLWDELDLQSGETVKEPVRHLFEGTSDQPLEEAPGDAAGILVGLLGQAPVSPDDLARQSGLSIRAVHGILLELELAGRLVRHPGSGVSLSVPPERPFA
ncbi:MAG TPA: DNA-processing protein DprA [Beijerinckiaceae bacterium]|jgi:DNA processing protein